MRKNLVCLFCVVLGLMPLVGCDVSGGKKDAAVPVEERIKEIQNRTDMPEQAKAIAISQLKAREAEGQQGAGAALPVKK